MRDNYANNSDKYKNRAKKARGKMREFIISQKDKPCLDCNVKYPHYIMDFDHTDSNKTFNIGTWRNQSKQEVIDEIAKCELVCANCHRERTHKRIKNAQ